ncbi:MAG: hypothetical protein OXC05_14790 [Halieaceae bacterium]|nr:hypothetical protein [Halieaceae bacterium]
MITEARNFFIESEALYQLIRERTDSSLRQLTAFKDWSFEDIIRHLHVWNRIAHLSLSDKNGFETAVGQLRAGLTGPGGISPTSATRPDFQLILLDFDRLWSCKRLFSLTRASGERL